MIGVLALGVILFLQALTWNAPLELGLGLHGLEIHHVYRGRILKRESLPYSTLQSVASLSGGLVLEMASGTERTLTTVHRTSAELEWVAAALEVRIEAAKGEADPRLVALQEAPRAYNPDIPLGDDIEEPAARAQNAKTEIPDT